MKSIQIRKDIIPTPQACDRKYDEWKSLRSGENLVMHEINETMEIYEMHDIHAIDELPTCCGIHIGDLIV